LDLKNQNTSICVFTTGGTIEKIYDEREGTLQNRESRESMIHQMLFSRLRLPYTKIQINSILSKDSLFMTDADRELLLNSIIHHLSVEKMPILVIHGTDTMVKSAHFVHQGITTPDVPIVFTGAMKPLGFLDSDACQNVTEALLSLKLLSPGVYISFHNRIFPLPNVRKNPGISTFESY
jgi:L-asparaginase